MYLNVQTCIFEVNSTVQELVLNYQLTLCIVCGLHSHTQRARLQTCIAVTTNTQIHESTRGYIRGVYTNSGCRSPAL